VLAACIQLKVIAKFISWNYKQASQQKRIFQEILHFL